MYSKYLILFLAFLSLSFALETGDSCTIVTHGNEVIDPCPDLHECLDGTCQHKLIWPPTTQEIIGSILMVLIGGVANASGFGGAFLLTPILMLLFNYSTNGAVRVVYSLVFGGMIGTYIVNVRRKESDTQMPIIHYDLGLVCLPMLLLGASLGVLLNYILPAIVTLIALVIILIRTAINMWKKIKKAWKEEKQRNAQVLAAPIIQRETHSSESIVHETNRILFQEHPADHEKLNKIIAKERRMFPWEIYIEYLVILGIFMFISLLRGSSRTDSIIGVEYCGTAYWLIYFSVIPISIILSVIAYYHTKKEETMRKNVGYNLQNTFRLHPRRVKKFIFLSLITGFLASFAGIGGGLILIPFMIEAGMKNISAAATSSFMIIFTSFLSLYLVFIAGDTRTGEWLYFLILSLIGSFVIGEIILSVMKKLGRPSILMVVMWILVLLGLIVLPAYAIVQGIEDPHSMFGFEQICK